jgi:large subunit ribosomal protein L10
VKNTIAKKAIEGRKEAVIASDLKNQTGIVFVFGDVAAAAKAFNEASKKNEKLKPVAGYMEAEKLGVKQIEALASLPSREVLIAKILGSLVAPHRGMLGVVQGVPRAVVSVLNQIKETKTA